MDRNSNEATMLAIIIAVIGVILVTYSLLSHLSVYGGYNDMMGMGSSNSSQYYSLTNMFLAIVGTFMLASGIYFVVLRSPADRSASSQGAFAPASYAVGGQGPTVKTSPSSSIPSPSTTSPTDLDASVPNTQDGDESAEVFSVPTPHESSLVLRLLTGDERTIFRTIKDAGGETLQRDLVVNTKMSEAKVSRVIDKLVEKGLVIKERNGMGNKVRIEIEE